MLVLAQVHHCVEFLGMFIMHEVVGTVAIRVGFQEP